MKYRAICLTSAGNVVEMLHMQVESREQAETGLQSLVSQTRQDRDSKDPVKRRTCRRISKVILVEEIQAETVE